MSIQEENETLIVKALQLTTQRIDKIESRLTALEDKTTGLATNLIGRSEQEAIYQAGYREGRRDAALEQGQPAQTEPEREWLHRVWVYWDDGEISEEEVYGIKRIISGDRDVYPLAIMPYNDSDEPPAPPKEVE